MFEVIDETTGNVVKFGNITLNSHRTKEQGISEDALKDISKIMGISKVELIEHIRNKKNIDMEKYLIELE